MTYPKNWTSWHPAPRAYIRFVGTWDMQLLYQKMSNWFRHRKYHLHERVYKHKTPSPFGVERQYVWRAIRRISEYTEIVYDVYYHTYDAHEVEVEQKDGSKKKLTKGRILIELEIEARWDWEKKWNKSRFYHRLSSFYNKYIFKKRFMMSISPKHRQEFHDLHKTIEETLNMYVGRSKTWEHKPGVHKRSV